MEVLAIASIYHLLNRNWLQLKGIWPIGGLDLVCPLLSPFLNWLITVKNSVFACKSHDFWLSLTQWRGLETRPSFPPGSHWWDPNRSCPLHSAWMLRFVTAPTLSCRPLCHSCTVGSAQSWMEKEGLLVLASVPYCLHLPQGHMSLSF